MARFLPGLLACRRWHLSARLRLPHGVAIFELSPRDGLRSHLPASHEFDSDVEKAFAEKFGPERDGWLLRREGGFLVHDQKVFVPDFVFQHSDGTVVHLEIVGYWTPQYLEEKCKTLRLFSHVPIIVAVAGPIADRLPDLSAEVIRYKTRLRLKPVLDRLSAIRADLA